AHAPVRAAPADVDAKARRHRRDRRDRPRSRRGRGGDPRLRRRMRFEKWQALGNDYLILEHDELPFELTPMRVRRLCEAHTGVHADGVLVLARSPDAAYVAEL